MQHALRRRGRVEEGTSALDWVSASQTFLTGMHLDIVSK
jgi:hypothetical protein